MERQLVCREDIYCIQGHAAPGVGVWAAGGGGWRRVGEVLPRASLLYILRKRLAKMLKIFGIINAKEVQDLGG